MAANLIMQLPAQNPPGFASDWGSLSEPSHWSESISSSANQGAASGARGGLAIRLWYPIHGPEIRDRKRPDLRRGPETSYLLFPSTGGRRQTTPDDSSQTNIPRFRELIKSVNKKLCYGDFYLQQWYLSFDPFQIVLFWNKFKKQKQNTELLIKAGFGTMS